MATAGDELLRVVRAPSPTGVDVLALIGELDLYTRPILDEAIASCHQSVVLDLRELTFLDSTGVQIMLRLRRRIDALGGYVHLAYVPGQQVARVLEILGLDRFFPPYDVPDAPDAG